MKVHTHCNRRIWYDNKLRMWTMQTVDVNGYQIGDVEYTAQRKLAFDFLFYFPKVQKV